MKPGISPDAVVYIAGYAVSISQKHQADVLVVDWENNTHGAVFGTVV